VLELLELSQRRPRLDTGLVSLTDKAGPLQSIGYWPRKRAAVLTRPA